MKIRLKIFLPELRDILGPDLEEAYRGVRNALLKYGELREDMLIVVNGISLRLTGGPDAELGDGDVIVISPPPGGG
ncbi:hypothetical protein DRO32_02215 [Candidatus Bathyarchaeota archaeon]|nr:MAG: hypothetical protein DRO32_02215 [Candidatus Bathyarchaeota archaeon]